MSPRQPSAPVADVLAEAGFTDDAGLARALEGIRALRPGSVPAPTGELAALFAGASTLVPAIPHDRPAAVVLPFSPRSAKRHRGTMISALVVAGMGLGATGVAALGGDAIGWIFPDPPAVVAESRVASAPAVVTPPSAAVPVDAAPATEAAESAVPAGAEPDRAGRHKGAQPTKSAAAVGGRQGQVGGIAVGREPLKDLVARPLAPAQQVVSDPLDALVDPLLGVEAGTEVSLPGLEGSVKIDVGATPDGGASEGTEASEETGLGADELLEEGADVAEDSVSELRELTSLSRGEAAGPSSGEDAAG